MEKLLVNLSILIFFLLTGFAAGFIFCRNVTRKAEKWDKLTKKIEDSVLSLFKREVSSQQADKSIHSILGAMAGSGFLKGVIIRSDGSFLTNIMNNEIITDAAVTDFLINSIRKDYSVQKMNRAGFAAPGYSDNSSLFRLLDPAAIKRNFRDALVHQYNPAIQTVNYFLIFFTKGEDLRLVRHCELIGRFINILLYLKEFLSLYNEKEEFMNRLFFKNPVPLCVSDRSGNIIQSNASFSNFSPNIDRITRIIDNTTFTKVIDGHTLEKDAFYGNKNLKIYGMPLHSHTGVIKGGIFTLLDESLQYLLLKKLEASEERYKKFLKELPIGLAIINQEGIIYFVNDNFISSLGFTEADKLQGNPIQNYFDIPDNNFKEIANKVQEQDFLLLKLNLRNDQGNDRIFSAHLQKILLGDVELIEATFQDISLENKLYAQLAEKTKMIEEELSTARKIWNHVLSIPPVYSSLIRFETFFKPSSQLGGDFCDIIQVDDYHIGVIMADVSGHGVSASLMTSMLKMLVEYSQKEGQELDDIVNYLNLVLLKILPEDQYITLLYGIIDLQKYTFDYINCGHPCPILFAGKTGEISTLEGMTYPLGVRKNVPFHEARRRVALPTNCKILVFTDGILTFRKENRMMRTDDLIEIFLGSIHLRTRYILNDMYMKMLKTSTQFADDDVSMLLIIINKELMYKKFLSIPSNVLEIDNAILKITNSINKVAPLDEEEQWKSYTALYEAMINAVEHGNRYGAQKRVTVIYRIFKNWIIMKVRDEGIGFDYKNLPSPIDDANVLKPSGRGVYIVKKVMDKVRYNSSGNEITMFMKLHGGGAGAGNAG